MYRGFCIFAENQQTEFVGLAGVSTFRRELSVLPTCLRSRSDLASQLDLKSDALTSCGLLQIRPLRQVLALRLRFSFAFVEEDVSAKECESKFSKIRLSFSEGLCLSLTHPLTQVVLRLRLTFGNKSAAAARAS